MTDPWSDMKDEPEDLISVDASDEETEAWITKQENERYG